MKKLFVGILFVLMLLFICSLSYAVNTITFTSPIIEITDIDSDWLWTDTLGTGMSRVNIISIQFNPGATDDECKILDTNAAGPAIFDVISYDAYDQRIKYFPQPNAGFKPFLDFDIGTYSSGAKIIIILGE